jgi:hypothetical protein
VLNVEILVMQFYLSLSNVAFLKITESVYFFWLCSVLSGVSTFLGYPISMHFLGVGVGSMLSTFLILTGNFLICPFIVVSNGCCTYNSTLGKAIRQPCSHAVNLFLYPPYVRH